MVVSAARCDAALDRLWLWGAVGVFPFRTHMTQNSMKMGYVEVRTQQPCALFPPEATVRGHVYHFSEILQVRPPSPAQALPRLVCRPPAEPRSLHAQHQPGEEGARMIRPG